MQSNQSMKTFHMICFSSKGKGAWAGENESVERDKKKDVLMVPTANETVGRLKTQQKKQELKWQIHIKNALNKWKTGDVKRFRFCCSACKKKKRKEGMVLLGEKHFWLVQQFLSFLLEANLYWLIKIIIPRNFFYNLCVEL